MKIEVALSTKQEGYFIAFMALIFVVYQLASRYGEIILGWFIPA